MPDEQALPGDKGDKSGIMIPKERFDEVSAKVAEARAMAEAAEGKYQAVVKERAAEATQRAAEVARLEALERRFAPEADPDVYEDPAEKALNQVVALTKKLEERDAQERLLAQYRAGGAAIMAAMEAAGIVDKKKAGDALGIQYGAAKHFGQQWDPAAAAKAWREEEKAVAELRAKAALDDNDATRSAITGGASRPTVVTGPAPTRPTPWEEGYSAKILAWERDMEQRLINEARAGG